MTESDSNKQSNDVGNFGERAVEEISWLFFTHLSIYCFALDYAKRKRVLELGSGSGYGAARLASVASEVLALEGSGTAIAHSQKQYANVTNLTYRQANFNAPLPLRDKTYDLIFSSNVFEHIAQVDDLIAESARVATSDATAIIAVPPIQTREDMIADINNEFHIHHLPPLAWYTKLSRYWKEISCHRHIGSGVFADVERCRVESQKPSGEVTVRETDFDFPKWPIDNMWKNVITSTISAIFVCRRPRVSFLPPGRGEGTPKEWNEKHEVAAVIGKLKSENRKLGSMWNTAREELQKLYDTFSSSLFNYILCYNKPIGPEERTPIGELVEGRKIIFFFPQNHKFGGILIRFATYYRENVGKTYLAFFNEKDEQLFVTHIDNNKLIDNEMHFIPFPVTLPVAYGIITGSGTSLGNSPTCWAINSGRDLPRKRHEAWNLDCIWVVDT